MLDNSFREFIKKTWKSDVLPMNVYKFAKKIGIIVTERSLPHGIFSVITCKQNATPRIDVALNCDPDMKQYACAVCLGHYVQNKILQKEEYLCFHSSLKPKTMEETLANDFAKMLCEKQSVR